MTTDIPINGTNGPTAANGHTPGAPSASIFTGPAPDAAGKTLSTKFGELVWLMSQSASHKGFFISDLEWMIMTPLLLQQYRVYYASETLANGQTNMKPLGAVLWGFVDAEVEARLQSGNAKLRPQDWKSGDKLWVVDVIAPFGGADAMVTDLKEKVFPARPLNMLTAAGGNLSVRVV